MNLLEVRPGTKPVPWAGETIEAYVGLDHRLAKGTTNRRITEELLAENPRIKRFELIGVDIMRHTFGERPSFDTASDEVLIRDVMSGDESPYHREKIFRHALINAKPGIGRVVIVERLLGEYAHLEQLAKLALDLEVDVDIFAPGDTGFDELWEARASRSPISGSRILVAVPTLDYVFRTDPTE